MVIGLKEQVSFETKIQTFSPQRTTELWRHHFMYIGNCMVIREDCVRECVFIFIITDSDGGFISLVCVYMCMCDCLAELSAF